MKQPFEAIHVSRAPEFLEYLSPDGPIFGTKPLHTFSSGNGNPTWVFRGQADATHTLLPSAIRKGQALLLRGGWKALADQISNGDQAGAEFSSLLAFFWAADEHGLTIPEDSQTLRTFFDPSGNALAALREQKGAWLPDFLLSLAALAQHYGLPTRLLDWSYNPLVAAYFAASSQESHADNLCVWALDLSALGLVQRSRKAQGFLRFVSAPRSSNVNLLAQDGLFTMYTPEPFDWDAARVATPIEDIIRSWVGVRNTPILFRISLIRAEAENLRSLLLRRGITGAKIFPGYAGVLKALRERGPWGSSWGYQHDVEIPAYDPSLFSDETKALRSTERLQPAKSSGQRNRGQRSGKQRPG